MPDDRPDSFVRPNDHLVEPVFAALEGEQRAPDASPEDLAPGAPHPPPERWWKRLMTGIRSPRT